MVIAINDHEKWCFNGIKNGDSIVFIKGFNGIYDDIPSGNG